MHSEQHKELDVLLLHPPVFRTAEREETSSLINNFWETVASAGEQSGDLDYEPPHGLLAIAAMIVNAGKCVRVIDLNYAEIKSFNISKQEPTLQKVFSWLPREFPPIVGITSLTPNFHWTVKLANYIKNISPSTKVILGGLHATFCKSHIVKEYSCFDVLVYGEGEYTIVDLLEAYDNKIDLRNIKGIVFRDKGDHVVVTPPMPPINNFNALPTPAYELLEPFPEDLVARICSARGCEGKCHFCVPANFYSRKLNLSSPEGTVKRIKNIMEKHKLKRFLIGDLAFFANENHSAKICNLLEKENLGINWWCQTRVDLITPKTARLLKQAGCETVALGFETFTQSAIDASSKDIKTESIKDALLILKDQGLNTQAYITMGLPKETIGSSVTSIELISRYIEDRLIDMTNVSILVPFPGTDYWESPNDYGINLLTRDFKYYYMGVSKRMSPLPVYETTRLTCFQIRALWELALSSFAKAHKSVHSLKDRVNYEED